MQWENQEYVSIDIYPKEEINLSGTSKVRICKVQTKEMNVSISSPGELAGG